MKNLPSYVVSNDPKETRGDVLTTPAQSITFPLSEEDKHVIDTLVAKYDQEENCAGLAAPQIGFGKRVIVFELRDDPQLKKWRPDLVQTMPKSVWINPSYTPIGEEKHVDYEACFSVAEKAGPVARYKKIKYSACTPDGEKVEGIAEGFLARMIQHETDHTNGVLYSTLVPDGELLTLDEYRARRQAAMEARE